MEKLGEFVLAWSEGIGIQGHPLRAEACGELLSAMIGWTTTELVWLNGKGFTLKDTFKVWIRRNSGAIYRI